MAIAATYTIFFDNTVFGNVFIEKTYDMVIFVRFWVTMYVTFLYICDVLFALPCSCTDVNHGSN